MYKSTGDKIGIPDGLESRRTRETKLGEVIATSNSDHKNM